MSIGEDKLINNLVKLDIYGKEKGKMNCFNGNIVRIQTDYFNKVILSLDNALSNVAPPSIDQKPSTTILRDMGTKIGFFLLGNIMISEIWKKEILPMIDELEDWVQGAISVLNSMGLGKWKIKNFHSDKRIILNLYDSFEAAYYLENDIKLRTKHPVCNISTGIASSLMSLIYDANIPNSNIKTIDYNLYKKCCKSDNAYIGKELKCRAINQSHCEIIVERLI